LFFLLLLIYIFIGITLSDSQKSPFYAIDAHHILLVPGLVGETRPASTQIGGPKNGFPSWMDVTVEALKLMGSLCRINQTFLKATIET
jgi:hypothetical protein